jgi:signal transduction histidine kinase
LVLLLRDISAEQQRAALERVFYHDVSNLIENLVINSRLLNSRKPEEMPELANRVEELASRLASEVRIQKAIARGPDGFDLTTRPVFLDQAILNLRAVFHSHPAAQGKMLRLPPTLPELRLSTDGHLLERVLLNMVTNALEATGSGGEVRLWVDEEEDAVTFCVWNQGRIPDDVALRVFQRNFSTKTGDGRGLGTYAMKLLGETYMRGQVGFTTSEAEGTVFRLRLPKNPPPGNRAI